MRMLESEGIAGGAFSTYDQGWICESGMPEEPRRQRGDDGHTCAGRVRTDAAGRGSGGVGGQYVQLYRSRTKGVGGRHSGDGRAQEIWRGEETDCGGLFGGALPRANFR